MHLFAVLVFSVLCTDVIIAVFIIARGILCAVGELNYEAHT